MTKNHNYVLLKQKTKKTGRLPTDQGVFLGLQKNSHDKSRKYIFIFLISVLKKPGQRSCL